ncbi:MAG TPA: phospholipase D-like domain-containing protein [Armatimonadaceae bacterium]|nr:phospholipase D-like domain-containing protein [Armatimonadaceae bacterium]
MSSGTRTGTGDVLAGGEPLLARVRAEAAVPGTTRMRFALGYLFVPGLAPIWDALEASTATDIRLLIGNTTSVLSEEQRAAAGDAGPGGAALLSVPMEQDVAAGARAARDRVVAETAAALRENLARIERTDANAALLVGLARAVAANRLRVRIYPDGRLHAKVCLFDRESVEQSVALVGSTNLTLPAPGNPTELNVATRGEPCAAVSDWFGALWDEGQDFTRAFVGELLRGWPLSP